jgi:hypothetical protein
MPAAPGGSVRPRRAADLDISASEDGCIVSRPGQDKIHFLNPTAVFILELCTGENNCEEIAALVKQAYNLTEAPVADVRNTLEQLESDGLLQ